jgi:hypothetical protein
VSDIDITAWYAHWLFSWTLNAFPDIKGSRRTQDSWGLPTSTT